MQYSHILTLNVHLTLPSFPPASPIIVTFHMTSEESECSTTVTLIPELDRDSLQSPQYHILHNICPQTFLYVISTSDKEYSEKFNNCSFRFKDDDPIF